MIAVLLATLLSSPVQAQPTGMLTGAWRVHTVQSGQTVQRFPDVLLGGEQNITYGRWLWIFGPSTLTLATQLTSEHHDRVRGTIDRAKRDGAWAWCQAQITVPLTQQEGLLRLPARIQNTGTVGRFTRKGEATVQSNCAIQLTGVATLEIVANTAEAPRDAVTLATQTRSLQIVLIPDGTTASLDPSVKRIESHLSAH